MGLLQALNLPPPPQRASQSAPAHGAAVTNSVAPPATSARQPPPTGNRVFAALAPSGKGPSSGAVPVTLAIHKPRPFEPGSQQQLAVTAMFSDGSVSDFTAKVKWSSSDEALVKVLPGGLVKVGYGAGPVTITAAAPGGKPRVSIDVKVQAPLQDIVVTPANPLVESGGSETMVATGVFADGSTEDLRFSVKWSSDKPKVADFSGGNECVAKAAGTATVWATDRDGKVSGSTKVTVAAAGKVPTLRDVKIEPLNPEIKNGAPVQFKATGVYSDKSTHEITGKVDWESSHPDILAIDDWGLAKPGLQSGSALIRASDPVTHRYRSTTAYVEFPGILRIDVSPKDIRLGAGDSADVTVTATLHGGAPMNLNHLVRFTPADTDVAVVTAGGEMVVGRGAGTTTIEVLEPSSGWSDDDRRDRAAAGAGGHRRPPARRNDSRRPDAGVRGGGQALRHHPQGPRQADLELIEPRRDRRRSIRRRHRQGSRRRHHPGRGSRHRASWAASRSARRPDLRHHLVAIPDATRPHSRATPPEETR